MHLSAVTDMLFHDWLGTGPELAPSLAELTQLDQFVGTIFFQMPWHVFPWNSIDWTPIRTWHWKQGTLPMMTLQCVSCEGHLAILTIDHALGTRVDLMCLESIPLNLLSTFVFAINRFESTRHPMIFNDGSCEVLFAVIALHESLLTCVQHVVFHDQSGDSGSALIKTQNGVFLAGVQVSL